MEIKRAYELARKFKGEMLSLEQLEYKLKRPAPYVVGHCFRCESDILDAFYVWIGNAKLEKRAKRLPFGGIITTERGKYTAISDCRACGQSAPVFIEVNPSEIADTLIETGNENMLVNEASKTFVSRFPSLVFGMSVANLVALWNKAGKPIISLGHGNLCVNLAELLETPDLIYDNYPKIQEWISNNKGAF